MNIIYHLKLFWIFYLKNEHMKLKQLFFKADIYRRIHKLQIFLFWIHRLQPRLTGNMCPGLRFTNCEIHKSKQEEKSVLWLLLQKLYILYLVPVTVLHLLLCVPSTTLYEASCWPKWPLSGHSKHAWLWITGAFK